MKRGLLAFVLASAFGLSQVGPALAESDLIWRANFQPDSQGNCQGVYNSQIRMNGGDISSNQTEYPGNRADRNAADLAKEQPCPGDLTP